MVENGHKTRKELQSELSSPAGLAEVDKEYYANLFAELDIKAHFRIGELVEQALIEPDGRTRRYFRNKLQKYAKNRRIGAMLMAAMRDFKSNQIVFREANLKALTELYVRRISSLTS